MAGDSPSVEGSARWEYGHQGLGRPSAVAMDDMRTGSGSRDR